MASQEYHHVNLVFEIKQIVSWQLRGEAGSGCGEMSVPARQLLILRLFTNYDL